MEVNLHFATNPPPHNINEGSVLSASDLNWSNFKQNTAVCQWSALQTKPREGQWPAASPGRCQATGHQTPLLSETLRTLAHAIPFAAQMHPQLLHRSHLQLPGSPIDWDSLRGFCAAQLAQATARSASTALCALRGARGALCRRSGGTERSEGASGIVWSRNRAVIQHRTSPGHQVPTWAASWGGSVWPGHWRGELTAQGKDHKTLLGSDLQASGPRTDTTEPLTLLVQPVGSKPVQENSWVPLNLSWSEAAPEQKPWCLFVNTEPDHVMHQKKENKQTPSTCLQPEHVQ